MRFCDGDRIIFVSHHRAAITDNNIAVGDDMTERSLGQNASALHDDAVIDFGALFNHNVAEQDGVLYLALDAAAVGDEAVLYVGFIARNRSEPRP